MTVKHAFVTRPPFTNRPCLVSKSLTQVYPISNNAARNLNGTPVIDWHALNPAEQAAIQERL